jgi:hypothetical protein
VPNASACCCAIAFGLPGVAASVAGSFAATGGAKGTGVGACSFLG